MGQVSIADTEIKSLNLKAFGSTQEGPRRLWEPALIRFLKSRHEAKYVSLANHHSLSLAENSEAAASPNAITGPAFQTKLFASCLSGIWKPFAMLSRRLNAPASISFPATRNDGFNFKYLEILMSLQSSTKIRHSFSNCHFSSFEQAAAILRQYSIPCSKIPALNAWANS